MAYVGIEIGGTKLQLVLSHEPPAIDRRWRHRVDPTAGADGIRRCIEETIGVIRQEFRVTAVGAGFGGPVDNRTGCICRSHQVAGWEGFHLVEWLASLADAPAQADNDANVAALGEAHAGAGKGFDPVCYVTLGSGVGGGLIVSGKIYHGAVPGEAEIGHLRLDRAGTTVESRCSGWAIDQKIRDLIRTEPDSLLARQVRQSPEYPAKHLLYALTQGDNLATNILHDLTGDLAFAISHVAHLFHPETVILGGGLSFVGEPLRNGLTAALGPLVMEAFHPPPIIAMAALGEDAVPTGSLFLAKQAALSYNSAQR